MEKLSDHLYIPPMGKVIEEREIAAKAARKQLQKRYAAARVNNQNANWSTQPTGANWEHRNSLQALRARSRQAARDNGFVKNFLEITQANVIGHKGIRLQCRAAFGDGRLKVDLNKQIEDAWRQWGHAETCTVSGKLDWKGVKKLIVKQLLRDGEFLVQMVEDAKNPFGFSLKVWDVNWLDENFNVLTTADGNGRIIMSVEVDAYDKPVAYWFTTPPSEMHGSQQASRVRKRVPAEQIIHGGLLLDDESQTRYVPWLHAGLLNAKNLQSYEEGVIQSARMAANVFGFIEQEVAEDGEWTGQEDSQGNPTAPQIDVRNLSMNLLNPGQKFSQIDPKQPTQNHPAFMKTEGIHFGASVSLPYFLLFGDWEATNFSSSRGGLGEAKQIWKGMQEFIAENLCRRVFHEWLKKAWLYGAINITAGNYAELQNPKWIPRGWDYIDPTKDVAADVERLRNRLATPSEILTERGEDYGEFLDRWAADRKIAADRGIDIDELYLPERKSEPQAADQNEPTDQPANQPQPKRALAAVP